MNLFMRFVRDDRGLETVEWAVLSALIVGALITAIGGLSTAIQGRFNSLAGTVNGISP